MQQTKHILLGVCAAVVLAVSAAPMAAHAQTTDQLRQQLINEIYRLLAELARVENQAFYYYQPGTRSTQWYYPDARVLGAATGNAQVAVETLRAIDVEADEASVYGNVDLDRARYADVRFEYGQDDDDLDERSRMGRIDRNDRRTFRADLEDLDEDERYYYRAVARDPQGRLDYGAIRNFFTDEDGRDHDDDDNEEPDVDTGRAFNIDEDSAEFDGEVDMNDFRNGRVFFAYGEDEDQIADIARDYDEYRNIDEDGDDLQVALVDSDLDDDAEYEARVFGLDDDTEHFFTICVEYEDEDDDETIICGDVEDFETDRD